MPKLKQRYKKPLREINQAPNILQTNRLHSNPSGAEIKQTERARGEILSVHDVQNKSKLSDSENCQPSTSSSIGTSELYDELNSFRDKWKRELGLKDHIEETRKIDEEIASKQANTTELNYKEAKRLFLIAVDLEKNDKQYESIRYYKRSMHLCPDIERQIFKEQCEASLRDTTPNKANAETEQLESLTDHSEPEPRINLYERVLDNYLKDSENQDYTYCRPQHKVKLGTLHISDLPHELLAKIVRHVVGDELDLASLEQTGMVCRGFYIMSRDKSLWRDICFRTWGASTLSATLKKSGNIDWRKMFLERPRVNFDGVYISRTRYFRQGDVGFQDITYRPFHVVRYYRYIRFFPDSRVLILTSSEDPDKIVPIFRHALNVKQFSPELSALEGTYEFSPDNQVCIIAEKKFRQLPLSQNYSRRQAHKMIWSQQTPLAQEFNLRFELNSIENRPYRNNMLKWLEYTIVTKLDTGQEVTNFDMSPDTFPNLVFSRVKRFNLRSANPLPSYQ